MRVVINIIFTTVFLLVATTAVAQNKAPQLPRPPAAAGAPSNSNAAKKIDVKVISIYASKEGAGIDPSLASLSRQLERGFQGYTSFKNEGEKSLDIPPSKSATASLANGGAVSITYLEADGAYVKLKFEIPGKVSTTLRISRGSTFFSSRIAL